MSPVIPVSVEGDWGIAEAASMREVLLGLLSSAPGDLTLDLRQVASCDSAGVQLLVALRRSLAARGAQLRFSAVADPVKQAFSTYGLTAMLADAPEPEPEVRA